jgi:hypothetical protein
MVLTREQRQNTKYAIHNADAKPREVVIEHPSEENWTLSKDGLKPEESSASFHRFRLKVDAGKTETVSVDESRPEETQCVLNESQQQHRCVANRAETRYTADAAGFREHPCPKAEDRRPRSTNIPPGAGNIPAHQRPKSPPRKHESAKGSAEEKALTQRYTGQLNAQEDRFASLQKEIANIKTQRDQAQQELERMVWAINLDEGF